MQAFPFRGRCPSAHTGADEVHPFKPSVPLPIIETGRPSVPPLRPGMVSSRWATARVAPAVLRGHVWTPERAGLGPAPTAYPEAVPPFAWGPVPDRPADNGPAITCSAQPGAEVEPQQLQFLLPQAPVGRWEFRPTTQISTRRKFCTSQQVRVPRTGVRGRLPLSRGDGRRPEGIGRANMSAKRSS